MPSANSSEPITTRATKLKSDVTLNGEQVWMYFPQHGWMWISREYYPYYYDYLESRWLYLIYADDKVARFYHYMEKKFFTLEK